MRTAILFGKSLTLLFWLVELANLFALLPKPLSIAMHGLTLVILVIHLVEVGLFTKMHGATLLEPKYHKMMILVFGVFHWLQLLSTGEISRAPGTDS